MGTFNPAEGVPTTAGNMQAVALTGWGSREELKGAAIGEPGGSVPQLWLCGDGALPAVYQRYLLSGCETRLLRHNGGTVGVCYEDEFAEYCLLTGILPSDLTASQVDQTTSMFENIEAAMQLAGMDFSHVARTWLYMDRILEWYDPFNRARDSFFESRGVFDAMVPASTGIGSANLCGAAITACAIGVKPRDSRTTITEVESPLQCSATDYRSSFSRAVEIATPANRTLLVSGTASIEPGGATIHADDVGKQIQLTMDVVEAILSSRDMGWQDATRAVMYLKQAEYNNLWQTWLRKNELTNLPLLTVVADVCRDDLLVELEIDTVKKI